jgi:hypothetical protein
MIPSIGKPKISYKDHSTVNFESLDFYITLAQKIIAKFGGKISGAVSKNMLKNEDAISFVANAIMMGDWRWKDTKNNKSLYSYRNQCGIWAIKTYITKFYKSKNSKRKVSTEYSLNYINMDDGHELEQIVADKDQLDPLDILINNENEEIRSDLISEILESDILSEKQKQYIRLYFFENLTLDKIGKQFGVTREAVRQSIKVSISKIQNLL